ncbi:MAG: Na/Pi cotransporter family protein [Erysipelotrichaceae bacterium]|nr:Na/Pi cotransporter family protein [Erysipelotrichaceae bacterium]
MTLTDVIKLLGGVALFLFGMTLMGDSLKKVAGSKLELFLYKLTGNTVKGILLGTGVTAVIQSSSATSAMVVGFVNSGMMKVKQAIGIIMGAIIGTSITGWVISLSYIGNGSKGIFELLSTSSLASMVGVIGILLIMTSKKRKYRNIGEILMGFAVLMVGMEQMSGSVSGLRNDPNFLALFTSFNNPLLGILAGAGFTAIIQSASAAVGIIQALSTTGVISLSMSIPILIGIAIGASVPVIISSIGANAAAKKSALSYLIVDVLGGTIVSVLFYGGYMIFKFSFAAMILNPVSLALVNTIIRVIMVVCLAPFIGFLEKIVNFFVKENNEDDAELAEVKKLEERFLAYPPLAIENVSNAVNAMASKMLNILFESIDMIGAYDDNKFEEISKMEEIIDEYEDKINFYLTKLSKRSLSGYQSRTVGRYLRSISDIERISDHALNIAQCAGKIKEDNIEFTDQSKKELNILLSAIKEVSTHTVDSFTANSVELSYEVEPLEEVIDRICDHMKESHIERLQKGECNIKSGYIYNDLLTNFERVSDHCSNIAISTIGLYQKELDAHTYEIEVAKEDKFKEYVKKYTEMYKI